VNFQLYYSLFCYQYARCSSLEFEKLYDRISVYLLLALAQNLVSSIIFLLVSRQLWHVSLIVRENLTLHLRYQWRTIASIEHTARQHAE